MHVLIAALALLSSGTQGRDSSQLAYRGWTLGIAYDSAMRLARRQTGMRPRCSQSPGAEVRLCQTLTRGSNVILYFSPGDQALESVGLMEDIGPRVDGDSLVRAFERRWGPKSPLAGTGVAPAVVGANVQARVLAQWIRPGLEYGTIYLAGTGTRHVIVVGIDSDAHVRRMLHAGGL